MNARRSHQTRRSDEQGAILAVTAGALVLLLVVSALVIDLGFAHIQQRGQQNAADAAALGGIQDLLNGRTALDPSCNAGSATQRATCDAQSIANSNLKNLTTTWAACVDAERLQIVAIGTQCVSYGPGFTTMRVRVPKRDLQTLFAGVIGVNSLSTSKAAVAALVRIGPGGLRPFTLLSGFSSGSFCLDSGAGGNSTQPCDGGNTGNYGVLDFASCTGRHSFADSIAGGADHPYGSQGAHGVGRISDDCTQPLPNVIAPEPGNMVGQETPALIGNGTFADGGPALLRRFPSNRNSFSPAWQITNDGLDNRPLWEFIPSTTLPNIPASCQRATFDAPGTGLLATHPGPDQITWLNWGLDRCFFEYTCGKLDNTTPAPAGSGLGPADPRFLSSLTRNSCTGPRASATTIAACGGSQCRAPVFDANTNSSNVQGVDVKDIIESPRLIHIPEMWQTAPINGNSGRYDVKGFRAAFVQRIGPNNGAGFEPGPWNSGNAPVGSVADITGFVFPAAIPGCIPSAADTCGTMLAGRTGFDPFSLGENAVIQLIK